MTIERAFGTTFAVALALEVLRWFVLLPIVQHILFWSDYAILAVLGFLLGRNPQPYRTALANTLPFLVLWFSVGYVAIVIRHGNFPPDWTEENSSTAQWGWVVVSLVHLPLAVAASAVGVWLAQVFSRWRGGANAA